MLYSFAGTFDGSRIITLLNLFLCGTFLPLSAQSLDSPAILTKIVLFWFLIFSFLLRFSGFPFPYRSLQLRVCSVKKKKKKKKQIQNGCLFIVSLFSIFFLMCVFRLLILQFFGPQLYLLRNSTASQVVLELVPSRV